MKILLYIIGIVSIDIFYMLYRFYKKMELRKINAMERKNGVEESELTEIKNIKSKIPLVIYGLSALIVGFYLNFIDTTIYNSTNFFSMLKTEISCILIPLLTYFTINVFIRYLKSIFSFILGFKEGISLKDDDLESTEETEEETEEENEEIDEEIKEKD